MVTKTKLKGKIANFIDGLLFTFTPGLWLKCHFPEIFEEKQKHGK